MSTPKEWLLDLAEAAQDLGLGIRSISEGSIELYSGADVSIRIETRLLSGALLRSILRPRPDPAAVEIAPHERVDVPA